MMKIDINVFKSSGKFYANSSVERQEDIQIFEDEFKQLIRENLPARIAGGYVVVTDALDGDGFHMILYRMEDLI